MNSLGVTTRWVRRLRSLMVLLVATCALAGLAFIWRAAWRGQVLEAALGAAATLAILAATALWAAVLRLAPTVLRTQRRMARVHAEYSTPARYREVTEILLARGANVNAKSSDGKSPLHRAAEKGHVDVAEMLLVHFAKINAEDKDGVTPLHWATLGGHQATVELLLAHGADVTAQEATIDHLEPFPFNERIKESVVEICKTALIAASLHNLNLASTVRTRLAGVKERLMFHSYL